MPARFGGSGGMMGGGATLPKPFKQGGMMRSAVKQKAAPASPAMPKRAGTPPRGNSGIFGSPFAKAAAAPKASGKKRA